MGPGNPYEMVPDFETDVLSKLVSPATLAAYEASSWFQEISQRTEAVKRRQAEAAKSDQTKDLLAPDLTAAGRANIDMRVLGIPLGQRLAFPTCQEQTDLTTVFTGLAGVGHGGVQTCVGDTVGTMGAALMQFVQSVTGPSPAATADVADVPVKLADGDCPPWLKGGGSCLVFMKVQNGYALGATFVPSSDADARRTVVEQLTEKYHVAPAKAGETECANRYRVVADAVDLSWSAPGIYATYRPLAGDCLRGRVEIDTMMYHKLQDTAKEQQKRTESKI